MLAALAVRAELLGNASRTQFSAVACGVASGYVFAGALGCQSASSSGRAGDSAAGGFKSATRRCVGSLASCIEVCDHGSVY